MEVELTLLQVDKEGEVTMDDAAKFFGNVFGGDRFRDYVRYSLFPPTLKRTNVPFSDRTSGTYGRDDIYGVCGHV
jgi:hypothetical protein